VPEAQRPPAGKPEDAYYYIVRRVEGPADAEGHPQVLFQTIDHAFLECPPGKTTCEAGEKKLVTASYPFSGYLDSFGAFGISPAGAFALQPVVAATAFLMWTYDNLLPGKALAGVVTGKVLRTRWDPLATVPTYEPVEGAVVTAVQMTNEGPNRQVGQRLFSGNAPMATTRADGTFTLWDPRYVGGTVQVAATLVGGDVTTLCPAPPNPKVVCGTAFESDPADWKTTGLQFHRNIATVNLTFPPVEPQPPAPAIEIKVYRTKNGQREDTLGISSLTEPLILGLRPSAGIDLREVQIQGAIEAFRVDPLKGQPTGMDWILEYQPGTVGTYRVEATGLRADSHGSPEAIKGGTTFRVIGEAGRDEIVEGQRPEVIPARTSPKTGQKGVSVTTFVQVVFTEPVKKISGNVTLADPSGNPVPVKLSGVLRGGGVVDDLDQAPDAAVTSLTVQPLTGLQYGVVYTLSLGDSIQDLDTTACPDDPTSPPCGLEPYETTFTTFNPESLSEGVESFGSPGIVVLGERAYLVHNYFSYGTLRVFETTDPVTPLEIPNGPSDSRDPRFGVAYRPVDIVGEAESPLTGGRVVAVATGPAAQSKPSNIWLLDVNDDSATRWIGAVSLTATAAEGFINRTFMRAGVLYSATQRKGIQVVDLGRVVDNFKPLETNAAAHFQMRSAFLTDGQGYGNDDVISIEVPSPFGGPARLSDLKAGLIQTEGGGLLVVAAAADHGLVVANPGSRNVLSNDKVTVERPVGDPPQMVVEATLRYGQAIGMGNVAGQDVTVVVGSGTILQETQSRPMLMVVSLLKPESPKGLGYLLLDDATVGDVLFKDDLVLLGGSQQAMVVSLTDPAQPKKVGTVSGVGGRLALGPNNILFGTAHSVFGGTDVPLGGVRTAALGSVAIIENMAPALVAVNPDGKTRDAITITYRLIAPPEDVTGGTVRLLRDQPGQVASSTTLITSLPLPDIEAGRFKVTVPAGLAVSVPSATVEMRILKPDGTTTGPYTTGVWNADPLEGVPPEVLASAGEVFDALSPTFVVRGVGDTTIAITGRNLSSTTSVQVRGPSGSWMALRATLADNTTLTVKLPASLFATEGFVQVSPDTDAVHALGLMVADPGLPRVWTPTSMGPEMVLAAITPGQIEQAGGTLTVSGQGLPAGTNLVLGRGDAAGILLPTTAVGEDVLEAALPEDFIGRADDLFIAAVSSNGTQRSAAQPIRSVVPARADPALQVLPGDAGIVNVSGDLVWNRPQQALEVEGVGLSAGMTAVFSRNGTEYTSVLQTPSQTSVQHVHPPQQAAAATSGDTQSLAGFKIVAPPALTAHPSYSFALNLERPVASPLESAKAWINLFPEAEIPLGGRKPFAIYSDVAAGQLFVVETIKKNGYWTPNLRPSFGKKPPRLTMTEGDLHVVQSGWLDPRLQLESESADPNVTYVRGVRLTSVPGTPATTPLPTLQATSGTLTSKPIEAAVVRRPLGNQKKQLDVTQDGWIQDVASNYGIPPQYLKRQVQAESSFLPMSYRYEALTIDLKRLTGDVTTGSIYGPNGRWIGSYPFAKYRLATQVLSGLQGTPTTLPFSTPGQTVFDLNAGTIYSRKRMPVNAAAIPAVQASVAGRTAQQQLNARPMPATAIWSRAGAPQLINPPPSPGARDWSVDYVNGRVTLYQPLKQGETLSVTFEPLGFDGGVVSGDFSDPSAQTDEDAKKFSLAAIPSTAQFKQLTYVPGETIASWLQRSVVRYPQGQWFINDSENMLQFENATKQPVDTRLAAVQAQFYAAASYGALQTTLAPWGDSPDFKAAFDTVLKVDETPLYKVAVNWRMGLELGGAYHRFIVDNRKLTCATASEPDPQRPRTCTQDSWEKFWSGVMKFYNLGQSGNGAGVYHVSSTDGRSVVVRDGAQYEPR
jgi:hypothetical protein